MKASGWIRRFLFSGFCVVAVHAVPALAYAELDDARIVTLVAQLPAQPAGIGPACADRARWGTPEVAARTRSVIDAAEKLLTQEFPAWDDKLYLEYSQRGTRPAGERMMNARKAWLYPLVLAECVSWTGRYLPAIQRTLDELVAQPTWTWAAHDGSLRSFRDHRYEVDLFTADTAHDIAQTLWLLGDHVPAATRAKLMAALEARVFAPVRETLRSGNKDHWWLHAEHNWNAVCLKGVVGAALAVLPDVRERALFAAMGEHYIRYYLKGFPEDGYSVEGPGYWNYGFSHFVVLREQLLDATQGKLDLFRDESGNELKVRNIALYSYRYEMLPGNVAAFGDASPRTKMDELTRAYTNAALGLGQAQQLAEVPITPSAPGNAAPLAEASLKLFMRPQSLRVGIASEVGLQGWFGTVGVLVSRPAAGQKLAASIKAGGNANHSHNDVGSYTVALGEEQPVGDAGATVYSSKTFSKERYTIRGINSWGHPVPVVNGELQREATKVKAPVLMTRFSDAEDAITIDMRPAYAVSGLKLLERSLRHAREGAGSVEIEDRFEAASPIGFEVAIICTGNWRKRDDDRLEFWQKKEHLIAQIEASTDYEIVSEKVDEEGLAFTRVAIRQKAAQSKGFVRVLYTPAP